MKSENKEPLSRQLLEELKNYFSEEISWKALDLKSKNAVLVFDLIIKDLDLNLSIKEKIEVIYYEKNKWLNKNKFITGLLVRELKYLYFNLLEKNFSRTVIEFQIFSVLDLIQKWDWEGLIDKDIASILINNLDWLWQK